MMTESFIRNNSLDKNFKIIKSKRTEASLTKMDLNRYKNLEKKTQPNFSTNPALLNTKLRKINNKKKKNNNNNPKP